jgi:methylation protein EvaC
MVEPFLDFGKMPLANAFLKEEEITKEYFFNLAAGFCLGCSAVQLIHQPEREKMFHADYPFLTGSSQTMTTHFRCLAGDILTRYCQSPDSFVVEIGSNDGTFLSNFRGHDLRHLGVEPSKKLADLAATLGVRTLTAFFDKDTASGIFRESGPADAIVAANVLCHIPYLHSVLEGVRILLKPGGVFCFEDPYLGSMLSKVSYDQIYDEHVFIFSLSCLVRLLERHGLEVFDLELLPVHGGSLRVFAGAKGFRPVSGAVEDQLLLERASGFERAGTFLHFRTLCEQSRDNLRNLLSKLKKQNKRVMGYAATSKSTTVINYCGLTPDFVESICDTTPAKQGKLSPGAHIPIVPHADFNEQAPDYALLFGWNHREEILAKERAYSEAGGKWIVYVPEVGILNE